MTDILLTNDDGYNSAGFFPLLKALSGEFSVVPVVPTSQKSWMGKRITCGEIEISKSKIGQFDAYLCSGTPADCVQVGIYDVLDARPKVVVSGINLGDNMGHGKILSSGTVGAAMEASIDGLKAVSVSLHVPEDKKNADFFDPKNYCIFENAAKIALKAVRILIDKKFCEGIDLVSVNIPFDAGEDCEFEITRPYRAPYGKVFKRNGGDKLIHVNPVTKLDNTAEGTDVKALAEGKVSITPISLELVSKDSMGRLKEIMEKEW